MRVKVTVILVLSVLAVLLVAGAVAAGVFSASDDVFGQAADGDDRIIATVGDSNMLYGSVRRTQAATMASDSSLTADQAVAEALAAVLTQMALYDEAERRGLVPTDDEVTAYVKHARALCENSANEECRNVITSRMNKTIDEYFSESAGGYRMGLAIGNLKAAVLAEAGVTGEEQIAHWRRYGDSILESATIDWKDADLQRHFDSR